MNEKKFAFFLPNLVGGGAERVTLNLVKYLAKHYGYDLDLVLVSATDEFMDQVPDNVNVVDLNSSRMITAIPGLVRYLKREKPHAILSAMDYVNVFPLICKRIARVDTRTIGCLHINLSAQIANPVVWRGRFVLPFVKWTHPWADVIVATSKGCGDDFMEVTGVGENNMEMIYNPTITEEILPLSKEVVDHRWFNDPTVPVIVSVGRMVQQKNFELLLDSFAELRKTREAKLLILGDGPRREKLENQAVELGIANDVDMPGFVKNPYAYMAKCKMLVMSSRFEALPAVLIEALHIGIQVVSTDCPNGPNEILENGKYGSLVPMEDIEALAAAMVKCIDNKTYVPDETACTRFMDEHVAEEYLQVLLGRNCLN